VDARPHVDVDGADVARAPLTRAFATTVRSE